MIRGSNQRPTVTIRSSYLSALALCTVVLGPASARTIDEIVSQGTSSMTGDIYSQGTRAQNGPWTGDIYSQGTMMPNGQIYSQGMEITWQDDEPGPQFGNPSWSPQSNTGNTGGNQSIDNTFSPSGNDPVSLVTDAFTNNAFLKKKKKKKKKKRGGNPNPGGNQPRCGLISPVRWPTARRWRRRPSSGSLRKFRQRWEAGRG